MQAGGFAQSLPIFSASSAFPVLNRFSSAGDSPRFGAASTDSVALKTTPRNTQGAPYLKLRPSKSQERFDLIVIGGGINGTGIARDAALRGLKVLVVEKDDLGSGTSSASTRLAHGGLRYLKSLEEAVDDIVQYAAKERHPLRIASFIKQRLSQTDVQLVWESVNERERLLRNAPHLVKEMRFAIPVYKPGENAPEAVRKNYDSFWKIALGLKLYDSFFLGKTVENSDVHPLAWLLGRSDKTFSRQFPSISADGLEGGVTYSDAQIVLPERICVENAVSALETHNAQLMTHGEVWKLLTEDCVGSGADKVCHPGSGAKSHVSGVAFKDTLSGEEYRAEGKVIVNAAGPWVDEIAKLTGGKALGKGHEMLGGTKGTHLVVKGFPGAPDASVYVQDSKSGRPFFIIPWQVKYNREGAVDKSETLYLIGTTDDKYTGSLDDVHPVQSEIQYLLEETNLVLPEARLKQNDVLYAYAGVRPLVKSNQDVEGKMSRKHYVADHGQARPYAEYKGPHGEAEVPAEDRLPGFMSVIGGKLTVYRALSEDTVDTAVRNYGLRLEDGTLPKKGATKRTPLPGSEGIVSPKGKKPKGKKQDAQFKRYIEENLDEAVSNYMLPRDTARALMNFYGIRYRQVLDLTFDNSELKEPLVVGSPRIKAQVAHSILNEHAYTLMDIMRRMGANWSADNGLSEIESVAEVACRYLNWDSVRRDEEVAKYRAYVDHFYRAYQKTSARNDITPAS